MHAMNVRGSVVVPGDKSISHRALILAALADGPSRLRGVLRAHDVESTAGALRALGAELPALAPEVVVRGVGLRGLRAPAAPLDCGNSGTTTRLLAGVAAGIAGSTTFVGDASLSRRPMRRVARPLERMGATVELGPDGSLPMTVRGGALRPLDHVSEAASAQVKSAVLLAGLVAGVPVSVTEPAPSRDHTERMLAARGVEISREAGRVALRPVVSLAAADVRVPGDPSSAAFLAALAALAAGGELRLPDVCLNPTRTGFLAVLARMGAGVELDEIRDADGDRVGTVVVRPGALLATRVEAAEVPSLIDELPLVACLAARAEGVTEIRGAEELRVKESDRIAAVVANLRALGVDADELPDGLLVRGGRAPLRGRVATRGDHRLAMAFGVLAALPGSAVEVDDRACVAVSYPAFWRDLARVVG
jgi:3-phosphoshikimate 1-carboxyvinyltransferase